MKRVFLACALMLIGIGSAQAVPVKPLTPVVNPSDLGFTTPNPEPTLISGIETFDPPYVPTSTNGPLLSDTLRTGGADETITLSGHKFINGTTKFDFFAQTSSSDWQYVSVDPSFTSTQTASAIVPSNFPDWSMYLVWPNNNGVRGKPFAVNRTEAWWVGPKSAVVGQTISIYGRNLSKGNGTSTSFVYIKPVGSSGSWVTPTSVNPYKVDITVPSLSAGTYEVWVHNGHGGRFGWSGPLTLTVLSASPWANLGATTYNVTSYGAVGDGVTDDGAAVEAAIAAAGANAPATVYFPAGTYAVGRTFDVPSSVRFLGAGRDSSTLKLVAPLSTITGDGFLHGSSSNILFEDITIDAQGMLDEWPYAMIFLSSEHVKFLDSRLNSKGANTLEFSNYSENLVFENVDVIGAGSFFGAASQIFVNNSTFRMTNDGEYAMANWGGNGISFTNSHLYNQNESVSDGHGIGRLFVGQGHFGSLRNVYFSGNETHNAAPRDCNVVDCNKGEQILFEFGGNEYQAAATAVSANTVTFSSTTVDPTSQPGGFEIMIVAGKGLGQRRKIVSVSSGVVTVDRNWDVTPDTTTSRFLLGAVAEHAVVYDNTFQGRTTHSSHDSASTAVNIFGNSFDIVVDSNDISRMRHGLMVVTHTSNDGNYASPIFFNLIANNVISDGNNGIYTGHVYGYDSGQTFGSVGNVFRRNEITDMSHIAIAFDQWDTVGGHVDSHVFERNEIANVPYGLIAGLKLIWEGTSFDPAPYEGTRLTGTVLRLNNFYRGTASSSGSIGFRSEPFNTWINQGSSWYDFESGNPWLLTQKK